MIIRDVDAYVLTSFLGQLGVHLRDLHSLLQNYPPTLEIQGRSLINFRRYYKFMEHVRGLRLFKPPDLERYRNGQLAYYLQHQLRGVHFDADTDVALMERSLELEADETRIHRCATVSGSPRCS
jgi:son of sevenless-like protein